MVLNNFSEWKAFRLKKYLEAKIFAKKAQGNVVREKKVKKIVVKK